MIFQIYLPNLAFFQLWLEYSFKEIRSSAFGRMFELQVPKFSKSTYERRWIPLNYNRCKKKLWIRDIR
jgi:hypothetical protein